MPFFPRYRGSKLALNHASLLPSSMFPVERTATFDVTKGVIYAFVVQTEQVVLTLLDLRFEVFTAHFFECCPSCSSEDFEQGLLFLQSRSHASDPVNGRDLEDIQ